MFNVYSYIMKATTLVGIDKSVDLSHYVTSHHESDVCVTVHH